ncbi:MAG: pilus assembly protein PilM [Planctomycetota bacterium]
MFWTTKNGLLGIDFGTDAVKVAQMRKSNGQLELIDATCAFSPGSASPSKSMEQLPESYWRALKFACHSSDQYGGRDAACLLPKSCTTLQFLEFGETSRSELQPKIQEYLESNVPGHAELSWDFWKWSNPIDAKEQEDNGVILTSRQLAVSTYSGFRSVGFHCRAVDGIPTVLSRAVALEANRTHPVAAVDWGANQAEVVIVVNGQPVFVRSLRGCGLGEVIRKCSEMLCFSDQEIYQIWQGQFQDKIGVALHAEMCQAIQEFVSPVIERTIEELRRTFSYLQSHRRHWRPKEVVLFGAGSLVPGIANTLNQRLSFKTSVWNPATVIDSRTEPRIPMSLLAPAMMLSTLAWEAA